MIMSDREYHRSLPNTSPPQPPSQRTYYEYNQNLSTFPEECMPKSRRQQGSDRDNGDAITEYEPSGFQKRVEDHSSRKRHRYDSNPRYRSRQQRSRSPRDKSRDRQHRHMLSDPDTASKSYYRSRRRDSPDCRHDDSKRRRHPRRSSSISKPPTRRDRSPRGPVPYKRSSTPLPSQESAYQDDSVTTPTSERQKPNYDRSGKLAAETNTVAGTSIILKYNEPPDARKPPGSSDWRLYVFKGSETLETVQLGERSCWLFGRERTVADFPIEHLSCSKQHAVLQFRYVEKANEFGERKGSVKPYVIDLESANGTKVNTEKVPEKRFVELASGDVVCFGESTREYVIMLAPRG